MQPTKQDIAYTMVRSADMRLLHPKAMEAFLQLEFDLKLNYKHGSTRTNFRPFETYRHPLRQIEAVKNRTSRAGAYESAHQFGLAVDFVPFHNDRWSWSETHDWDHLRAAARKRGLLCELDWDRAHVEHPLWQDFRACLRHM